VAVVSPVCFLIDSIACKFRRKSILSKGAEWGNSLQIDIHVLLSYVKDFSSRTPLRPDYDAGDIEFLESYLNRKSRSSKSMAYEVLNEKGDRVGIYLYRLSGKKHMEVMLLLARDDSSSVVFNNLLNHALDHGVTSLEGRMAPWLLQSMSDNNCLVKCRSWAVFGAKDPEILNVINRGDALFSVLDGEFVLTGR
jgi:hypothetical protein